MYPKGTPLSHVLAEGNGKVGGLVQHASNRKYKGTLQSWTVGLQQVFVRIYSSAADKYGKQGYRTRAFPTSDWELAEEWATYKEEQA
jgi:hypothetical protein